MIQEKSLLKARRIWQLRQIRLLDCLTDEEIEELSEIIPEHRFKKGEYIYGSGEKIKHLFLLKEGKVKLSAITEAGKERIINIFQPGDIFGELFLVEVEKESYHNTEAVALTDALICKLDRATFLQMLRTKPELSLSFIRVICQRLYEAQSELEELSYQDTRHRLAHVLLKLGNRHGVPLDLSRGAIRFDIEITHETLAGMLGKNRSYISSIMSEFKEKGMISYRGRQIALHPSKLKAFLKGQQGWDIPVELKNDSELSVKFCS